MKNAYNLWIDVVALIVYLIVANPIITGLAIHEWISLGVFIIFIVAVSSASSSHYYYDRF